MLIYGFAWNLFWQLAEQLTSYAACVVRIVRMTEKPQYRMFRYKFVDRFDGERNFLMVIFMLAGFLQFCGHRMTCVFIIQLVEYKS